MQQDATRNPSTLLIALAAGLMLVILLLTIIMPSDFSLFDEYGDDLLGSSGIRDHYDITLLQVPPEALHRHHVQNDAVPVLVTQAARHRRIDPNHPTDGSHAPQIVALDEAVGLDADTPMVAVTIGPLTRLYPLTVLRWHFCINDVLGETPIAVVHDTISRTTTVFDRRVGQSGTPLEFGVSGVLYYDIMLLYDRSSRSLWLPLTQTAISGRHVGQSMLSLVDWEIGRWQQMQQKYPDATVLSMETGHNFPYAYSNTISERAEEMPMSYIPGADQRLRSRERVVGIEFNGQAVAYPLDIVNMQPDGIVRDQFAGYPIELRVRSQEDGWWSIDLIQIPRGARVSATDWYAWALSMPRSRIYPDLD